jgi:hypothetical protein
LFALMAWIVTISVTERGRGLSGGAADRVDTRRAHEADDKSLPGVATTLHVVEVAGAVDAGWLAPLESSDST